MDIKPIDNKQKPIVVIDNSLDDFNDKELFPEKIQEANDMLKQVGLPKEIIPEKANTSLSAK